MKNWNFLSLISYMFLLVNFYGCKSKSGVKEISGEGLTVQLRKIPGSANVAAGINYGARIIPTKVLLAGKGNTVKSDLWYKADSCFYLQATGVKVYAQLVQPVANGVSGSFEYLLSFDVKDFDENKWSLIYQDKYLNHKKYTLSLNDF